MEELKRFLTVAKSLVNNTSKNVMNMTEDEWIVIGGCTVSTLITSMVLGGATALVAGFVIGLLVTGKVAK